MKSRSLERSQQGVIGGLLLIFATILVGYTQADSIVIKGVPLKLILSVAADKTAVENYLRGDKVGLHSRLQSMGVEAAIKAHYRHKIPNEPQLDQYIHQLFYELSGYVGIDYRVNSQGILVLRQRTLDPMQQRWVTLAQKLNVIAKTTRENDLDYVITQDGTKITYAEASRLFPLAMLEQLEQPNPHPSIGKH